MLYDAFCRCESPCENKYRCQLTKEDGVEPIGKIDWFDAVLAAYLYHLGNVAAYRRYVEKWRKAYLARGWELPSALQLEVIQNNLNSLQQSTNKD